VSLDAQPPVPGPQVGADEWVLRRADRREYLPSWQGAVQRAAERVGWWPKLAIAGLAGAALPLLGLGGFQLQVGVDALVIALLAVGLNIVVGWTLDMSPSSASEPTDSRCCPQASSVRRASTCQRSCPCRL
jgi:hypothetical protein